MQVKNYPQFAKNTFFLGLSRPFVMIYMLGFSFAFMACSIFSLNLLMIVTVGVAALGYIYFVYKFKMNHYWFDRVCLKLLIKKSYPFLAKEKTIISR